MDKSTIIAAIIGFVLGYMLGLIVDNIAFIIKFWLCCLVLKWLFLQLG